MASILEKLREDLAAAEQKVREVYSQHLPVIREALDRLDDAQDTSAAQAAEGFVASPAEISVLTRFLDHVRSELDTASGAAFPAPEEPQPETPAAPAPPVPTGVQTGIPSGGGMPPGI